jgi:hypothetical protein
MTFIPTHTASLTSMQTLSPSPTHAYMLSTPTSNFIQTQSVTSTLILELPSTTQTVTFTSKLQPTPTPEPAISNQEGVTTTTIVGIIAGSVGIIAVGVVSLFMCSTHAVSNLKSQMPQPKTNKLLQVEVDWPPKNLHLIKNGFKTTEGYPV